MKRREKLTIKENVRLNPTVFKMTLEGNVGELLPGQFVEVDTGLTLRRPFGVAGDDGLTLIYKVVGEGTEKMSTLPCGSTVDVLLPLGNSFDLKKSKKPLLIGGGIGSAPILFLAKKFAETGVRPTVIIGAAKETELFSIEDFQKIGNTIVCTDDGSLGIKGNVLDVLKLQNIQYDYYYACGPKVMLKALAAFDGNGEISLEARMGCGFGGCMGCSVMTKNGAKRVCADGPVFNAEEVIFDD